MKTIIASTFAVMILASSAGASTGKFVANDADHFGTDRYWEAVSQGNQ